MQIKDNDAAIVAPLIERNNETQWWDKSCVLWIKAAFFGSCNVNGDVTSKSRQKFGVENSTVVVGQSL